MGKADFSDIGVMKNLNTANLAASIRAWLEANPGQTIEDFARQAGVSIRTIKYILAYNGQEEEPNWTRATLEGIMKVVKGSAWFYDQSDLK